MNNYHISVLLNELIDGLNIISGGKYIDATLGGGGHSFEIIERGGKVLGLDADTEAIEYVREKVKSQKSKVKKDEDLVLVRGNFRDIDKYAKEKGFDKVNGIIFDLGISSHQIDSGGRGFSFQNSGTLDMRMDKDLNVKAGDLVNVLSKGDLNELFYKSGEEKFSYAIAQGIVGARKMKRIETTAELAEIIDRVVRGKGGNQDVKARIFQALRMAVNSELENLSESLLKAFGLLETGGRIGVISFHSLEDGIVKRFFNKLEISGSGKVINKKPILPNDEEVKANTRSRSAKLRFIEKI